MSSTTTRVPLAKPDVGAAELDAIRSVIESSTLALGPWMLEFEERIRAITGRRHAIAVNSGTAALHLAVRALGIGDGDEVITSPFSFVASANCIVYERAFPRFVDIEESTLGLDPDRVEAAGGARTKAILPVDVFGNPCRIAELEGIAVERGWAVIEDACEGLGTTVGGRPLGSFGDASAFAFYPNKQITTGEGGVVMTDDDALAETMRSMRNQGRDADGTWLRHVMLGFNYRMDEMSAAVGAVQLRRYRELREGRAAAAAAYEAGLAGLPWVATPHAALGADVDWFVYVVRLAPEVDRDRLIGQLEARGVPSRPYFSPLHLQPLYREEYGYRVGDFPVTERIAAATLALPFFSQMVGEQVQTVVGALTESVDEQLGA